MVATETERFFDERPRIKIQFLVEELCAFSGGMNFSQPHKSTAM